MMFVCLKFTLRTTVPSRRTMDGMRRFFSTSGQLREIAEHLEAGLLALLGVELHAEDVVVLHGGGDALTVRRRRHHRRFDGRLAGGIQLEPVEKVEDRPLVHVAEELA